MHLWRICRKPHAAGAFSGEGARLFGGRWNSPGTNVIYTSTSLALAAVETFVHLEPNLRPDDLVSIEYALLDQIKTGRVPTRSLPHTWHKANDEPLKRIGNEWIRAGKTLALYVPSAAVRGEWNVLINPAHADMAKVTIGKPQRFEFDLRMFR